MTAGTRMFNGKRFKEATFIPRKKEAELIKKQWQKDGYHVRLVKSRSGQLMYVRKK